ncbi:MAG: DUF1003 domain-containing protein [Hyphomonadaceae bacterium]
MPKTTQEMLALLRERAEARRHRTPQPGALGFGDRAADAVAAIVGSWRFILVQSGLLGAWLLYNALNPHPFDPFPFILLNLLLSFQAAYTAPVIMMSQNRQADIDRQRSIEDFEINRKAELEIETLHQKIDLLRQQEIAALTAAVARLTRLLEERGA